MKDDFIYKWIHNDRTWCSSTCDNKDCERNLVNRIPDDGLFAMAEFEGTKMCPKYKEEIHTQ